MDLRVLDRDLTLAASADQYDLGMECYQEWNDGSGQSSAQFYRVADGFLVRFRDIADFCISDKNGSVLCTPVDGSDKRWQAIYQQQVLPLIHSLVGDPVYHGAGVALGEVAVAFLGPSGRGKSTLTAAFARRGYAFLGDDCLHLVRDAQDCMNVQPHADHIRLWGDSIKALSTSQMVAGHRPGSLKPHLAATKGLRHCDRALRLARVYVLGDGSAATTMLTPLTAAEMILAWTRNAFVLDIKSPAVLRRGFDAATRLAQTIPARQLDYPRRYEALDEVVACVLADLEILS